MIDAESLHIGTAAGFDVSGPGLRLRGDPTWARKETSTYAGFRYTSRTTACHTRGGRPRDGPRGRMPWLLLRFTTEAPGLRPCRAAGACGALRPPPPVRDDAADQRVPRPLRGSQRVRGRTVAGRSPIRRATGVVVAVRQRRGRQRQRLGRGGRAGTRDHARHTLGPAVRTPVGAIRRLTAGWMTGPENAGGSPNQHQVPRCPARFKNRQIDCQRTRTSRSAVPKNNDRSRCITGPPSYPEWQIRRRDPPMTTSTRDEITNGASTGRAVTGVVLEEALRRAERRMAEQYDPASHLSHRSRPDHCTAP